MKEFGSIDRNYEKRDRAERERIEREQRERLERDRLAGDDDMAGGSDLYGDDPANVGTYDGDTPDRSTYDDDSAERGLYENESGSTGMRDVAAADRSVFHDESTGGSRYDDRSERDSLFDAEGTGRAERADIFGEDSARGETLSAGSAFSSAGLDTGRTESDEEMPIFPAEDTDRFRARWMEIQTHFVDEPRRSVEEADELVEEVTERLTSVFSRNREDLEQQWTAGDEVSTEDLRRTLQRYRTFFQRLLSV